MHARVLRYLDEVVRRGSIRKAAEHLHVAPTAVNRQILDLEAELGTPLFERIHKRLRLTPTAWRERSGVCRAALCSARQPRLSGPCPGARRAACG